MPIYSVLVYHTNTDLGLLDYGKSHYGCKIRTFDSFLPPILPISKSWGIIILANANVQNKQLGAGDLLTTDKLANVRIASVVGGFHLATQERRLAMTDTHWLVLVCISGVVAGHLLARYHDRRKR